MTDRSGPIWQPGFPVEIECRRIDRGQCLVRKIGETIETTYKTMKEIGKLLGLTSHQVGKKLKEIGLRTPEGKPSQEAFEQGFVEAKWTPDGEHYLWAWQTDKTVTVLLSSGVEPPAR